MDIEKLMNNSRVTGGKTSIERTEESEKLGREVRLEEGYGLGAEVTSGIKDDRDELSGCR